MLRRGRLVFDSGDGVGMTTAVTAIDGLGVGGAGGGVGGEKGNHRG